MIGSRRERALLRRIGELERELELARRQAVTDELTGCLNRRGWELALAFEQARCERHGLDAVVVVADLDGFKAVNDLHGHQTGDELLCRCAMALSGAVRRPDLVARPGGDEFCLLAVHTDAEAPLTRRIDEALRAADVRATVAAAALSEASSLRAAWCDADRRMLAAKAGRRLTARS